MVVDAQQVSNVLYVQRTEMIGDGIKLSMPNPKSIPFPISKQYLKKTRQKSILGSYYLPVQVLRTSPKGNIFKGINLRRLAFDWCLIKQGHPVAFDDHFNRDMKDRLLWQKEVITLLQDKLCTPPYVDYLEKGETSYLILGFAEGESLGKNIRSMLSGTDWKTLMPDQKIQVLQWYLQALSLVEKIHDQGIVHRDITDSNFIIMKDGQLCIIDFELSYSLISQQPHPPFLLGTLGYASPEQLQYQYPDFKDDVYSLGALLSFMLSGCPPHEFLNTGAKVINAKLARLTGSYYLSELVGKCLQASRKDRPAPALLKDSIQKYLNTLTQINHETIAMAL
jgi:serine/threonine protein kinase